MRTEISTPSADDQVLVLQNTARLGEFNHNTTLYTEGRPTHLAIPALTISDQRIGPDCVSLEPTLQSQTMNSCSGGTSALNTQGRPETPALDHVAKFRGLLGMDVVLLPINKGEKTPMIANWQNLPVEEMNSQEYLGLLKRGNLGVLLGKPSGGLCAIDIDDDALVEPFLAQNPQLRNTLRSKGARGQQIWLRITGDYPKLTKITDKDDAPWGEWRGDGGQSVIHGRHPSGVDYQIVHEAAPIELAFDSIKWPEDLHLPWANETAEDELINEVGPPYTISDQGAVRLNNIFWVRKYMKENTIIYDSALGEFFEYVAASGLWRKVTPDTIKRRFIDELTAVARRTGLNDLFLKVNDALATALMSLLQTMSEGSDIFVKRPAAIHVNNGMLCFEGDALLLKTFSPDYRSRNACPYAYDENAQCSRFIKELLQAALNDEDIALMQKWAGACLLGKNDAQKMLLMMGTPNGGKSTFMNIMEAVIGLQNVTQLRTSQLSNRFELYGFIGKTLLTGKDVPADFMLNKNAHVIKALIGDDLLSAEKKGHPDPVPLRGDFNLGITCNADLNIRLEGDLGAWRRRMIVIRYEKEAPAVRISGFKDTLLAEEGPGILKWMVDGARALLKELAEIGDYRLTETQKERVEELLAQSDSIRHFVERCVVTSATNALSNHDLRNAYLKFCERKGWLPMPASEVATQLPEAMLEKHRVRMRHDLGEHKSIRGYNGVALKIGVAENAEGEEVQDEEG